MKKLLLFPVITLAFAFQSQPSIKPIKIGTELPMGETRLLNVTTDKEISLNESKKANGLLVMFSCNTCPYVIANEDRIRAIQQYAQEQNIGMVIVNSNESKRGDEDSKDAMRNYASGQKFIAPYVIDENSKLADAFGATRTPESFLFDKDGKLVYQGALDDSPKDESAVKTHYLKDAMTALAQGKAITTATTVSVGCSIKRKQ